jgi:hypothetical protein
VPVDAQLLGREPERQSNELRQMQHRQVELLARILLDLALKRDWSSRLPATAQMEEAQPTTFRSRRGCPG